MIKKGALIPRIVFEPGFSLDIAHADNVKATPALEEKWSELVEWIPEIQNEWKTNQKVLLETTVVFLGRVFRRRELPAALIVSSFPSMSYPLVINVSKFIKPSTNPKPKFYFFSTLYHELLHRYLNENFSADVLSYSPLLRKYIDQREPRAVISHLHLFSVQKWVYLNLGREKELKEIVQWNSETDDPAYRRAWEIVNTIDDYEAYVRELQAPDTTHEEIGKQSWGRIDL